VKITRRLFPDLTNEYFINNSRALRRDVEKLLMDTGVGKSAYSIMEQGRVESILNSKPEDRRAIFDEAAGISKFKYDRMETEKKLSYTAQNLLRISDIISSMEKELENKERQSIKAKKYFQYKNDLSEADKNIRYLKWKSIRTRLKKADAELDEVRRKNEEIQEKMSADAKLLEEYETVRYTVEQRIKDIDKQLVDFISRKEILKEKVDKNKSIIIEYENRILELKSSLEQDRIRQDRYEQEKSDLLVLIEATTDNARITEESIEKFIEKREILDRTLEDLQKEIVLSENKILENEKTHSKLREDLKEIVLSLINQIEAKKRESERSEESRAEIKKFLIDSLEEFILISEEAMNNGHASVEENKAIFSKLRLRDYKEKLTEFLEMDDVFRDILFDKDGMLVRKEVLDQTIEELILENDNHSQSIREKNKRIEEVRFSLEENKEEVYKLEKLVLEMKSKLSSSDENKEKIQLMIKETSERILALVGNIDNIYSKKLNYETEVKTLEESIDFAYKEFLSISKILEVEKTELSGIFEKIQTLKSTFGKDQEEFKSLLPQMSDLDRKTSGLKVQLENFNEELYNDYSMTENELEAEKSTMTLKLDGEESRLREIKSEIQLLGSINPLAIEEYQNIKEIYDHHKSQKEDIESSKNDIEQVLKNINSESEKIFIETFDIIKKNFQETFSTLFNGGRATVELTEPSDLSNSGVEIIAEPPGKHVQNLKLLSGGEKSLTVIALLFAIYMVRPSPFCFLDEIDAALDEVNKVRFCQILDKFKDMTQFIVVTHAPPTISRANTIFGVTSMEPGVSTVVSLKMEEAKQFSKKIQAAV
jgi:chromosome segregation protein